MTPGWAAAELRAIDALCIVRLLIDGMLTGLTPMTGQGARDLATDLNGIADLLDRAEALRLQRLVR